MVVERQVDPKNNNLRQIYLTIYVKLFDGFCGVKSSEYNYRKFVAINLRMKNICCDYKSDIYQKELLINFEWIQCLQKCLLAVNTKSFEIIKNPENLNKSGGNLRLRRFYAAVFKGKPNFASGKTKWRNSCIKESQKN